MRGRRVSINQQALIFAVGCSAVSIWWMIRRRKWRVVNEDLRLDEWVRTCARSEYGFAHPIGDGEGREAAA